LSEKIESEPTWFAYATLEDAREWLGLAVIREDLPNGA
jgi:hypothetical protein